MAKKAPAAPAADTTTAAAATPAAPAAPAVAKPAIVKDEKNGVTRPSTGATLRVWTIADELSKAAGKPAERKEVTEKGMAEGLVVGTIHTQYGRWRKYYGLVTPKEDRLAAQAKAKEDRETKKAADKVEKAALAVTKKAEKDAAKAAKEAKAAPAAPAAAPAVPVAPIPPVPTV